MIRAKFMVTNIEKLNDVEVVWMNAVYSDDKSSVNYMWSEATPVGNLCINISNPAARNKFKISKEYYLDFTEV